MATWIAAKNGGYVNLDTAWRIRPDPHNPGCSIVKHPDADTRVDTAEVEHSVSYHDLGGVCECLDEIRSDLYLGFEALLKKLSHLG